MSSLTSVLQVLCPHSTCTQHQQRREFMKQIETENKVINVKKEYNTGSGKMELNIKDGDKKFIIPILVILGIILIVVLVVLFGQNNKYNRLITSYL